MSDANGQFYGGGMRSTAGTGAHVHGVFFHGVRASSSKRTLLPAAAGAANSPSVNFPHPVSSHCSRCTIDDYGRRCMYLAISEMCSGALHQKELDRMQP